MSVIERIALSPTRDGAIVSPPPLACDGIRAFKVGTETLSVYFEVNHGRPVLFLHGNSSAKSVWSHQLGVARALWRTVVLPDLPGHGDSVNSPTPEATYSFPGYAATISKLLDALGIDDVDVVGWSLGGHIGMQMLATDERVRSLLIVGAPPGRPSAETLQRAFHAGEDMQLAGKADFSDADAVAYGTAMMGGRAFLTPELLQAVRRTDGNARRCMVENALRGIGVDQGAAVASIEKPLCVIHGEHDPFVRLDYLASLTYCNLWKNRIFVISGAGHAPQWQSPAAFNRILKSFLEYSQPVCAAG